MYVQIQGEEIEFGWDGGNVDKSYEKHGVTIQEAEEIFADKDLGVVPNIRHSSSEKRFIALGKTLKGKNLFVAFTRRKTKIRVISARRMHKEEVDKYDKAKENSKI